MKTNYYIASVSFGKDSLAMLLKLLELHYPLNEVVFYDTGMEFQAIYNIRDRVKQLLQEQNIKYTELKPQCEFCYKMFEKPVKAKDGTTHYGYSWCGGRCRWGTTEKLQLLDKYCKGAIQYVGIAGDEPKRLDGIFEIIKDENKKFVLDEMGCAKLGKQISNLNKRYPLAEMRMTEKDCLEYCREQGFEWLENGIDLYDILDRVSCWCCANKNLKELKNYYKHLPSYWERLKKLQSKTARPFKYNKYTIFELEERFKKEENQNEF